MSITSLSADELTVTGRYLSGQLSPAEREAFEHRMRQEPAAVRALEATARLKVGLAVLRERGELDELLVPPTWSLSRRIGLSIAASVLVALLAMLFFRQTSVGTQRPVLAASIRSLVDTQGSALPITSSLAVFRKRAANDDAVIPASGAVELRVLPETIVESHRYRVSLARISDGGTLVPIASVPDLQPAPDDGFVTLFIDTSQLGKGRYRLDVSGKVPTDEVVASDTFLIRVVAADTP